MHREEPKHDGEQCSRYQCDWDLLALGVLDPDVQQDMSVHLRNCPQCQESFLKCNAVAEAISTVVTDRESVATPRRMPFVLPHPPNFLPWMLLAASLVCAVIIGHERDRLVTEVTALSHTDTTGILAPLCSRSVHRLEFRSVDPAAKSAIARAIWSRDSGLLFLASELPQMLHDGCCQLRIQRRNSAEPVVAGPVRFEAGGRGVLYVPPGESLSELSGLALTDLRGRKLLVSVE